MTLPLSWQKECLCDTSWRGPFDINVGVGGQVISNPLCPIHGTQSKSEEELIAFMDEFEALRTYGADHE